MKQHVEWDQELPHEARQRREVFARFGLASYHGQCIEKQLAMLISSVCVKHFLHAPPEERERLWKAEADKTLGTMLRNLEASKVTLPSGIHGRLGRALVVRNRLAHNFFFETDKAILTDDGREDLIAELRESSDFLASVDAELTEVYESWMIAKGVSTRAQIDAAVSDYLKDVPR
jgi:hypothetical protein